MLAALHPGRIDAGIGRTLGFTEPVRRALRAESADDDLFGADLDELRSYLDRTAAITVRPLIDEPIPLYVLATGTGLALAGARGSLPSPVGRCSRTRPRSRTTVAGQATTPTSSWPPMC